MTEAAPQETPAPRRWSIRVYVPNGESIQDDAMPKKILRETIRAEGFTLDATSLRRGDSQRVRVNDRGEATEWDGKAPAPDGYIVEWSATAHMPTTDEPPLTVTVAEDGSVSAEVPPSVGTLGGGVRVVHNLGGEVTVTAYNTAGAPVGYQFASALDDNQVHVELANGAETARLVITKDPEPVPVPDPATTPIKVPHPSERASQAAPLAP